MTSEPKETCAYTIHKKCTIHLQNITLSMFSSVSLCVSLYIMAHKGLFVVQIQNN